MVRFRNSLLFLSLIALTGCDNLWLGTENKEKLTGERINIVHDTSAFKIDEKIQQKSYTKPTLSNIVEIKSSAGLNPTDNANIEFSTSLKEKHTLSVAINKNFTNISSPIITDNMIVMQDIGGAIIAYDRLSYKKIWLNDFFQTNSNRGLLNFSSHYKMGGMTLSEEHLYVSAGTEKVLAINVKSGKLVWSQTLNSPTRSTPTIEGDKIFFQTNDDLVYALDKEKGDILWTYSGNKGEIITMHSAKLLSYKKMLIMQNSLGDLVGINPQDGNELWAKSTTSEIERLAIQSQIHDVIHRPIIVANSIVAFGNDGILFRIDANSGKQLWSHDYDIHRPIWASENLIFAININNMLLAIDINTGHLKWQIKLPSETSKKATEVFWTSPIMANDMIVTVSSAGTLLGFDYDTGEQIFEKSVIKNIFMPPLIVNKSLFLLSHDGKLVEYE